MPSFLNINISNHAKVVTFLINPHYSNLFSDHIAFLIGNIKQEKIVIINPKIEFFKRIC